MGGGLMKELGRHLIIELYGCDSQLLTDEARLKGILLRAVHVMGGTVKGEYTHRFPVYGGVTVLIAIAESHVSIHTWPEHSYAAIDVFTCGESLDPWRAFDIILEEFRPHRYNIMEIKRGMFERNAGKGVRLSVTGESKVGRR